MLKIKLKAGRRALIDQACKLYRVRFEDVVHDAYERWIAEGRITGLMLHFGSGDNCCLICIPVTEFQEV